MKTTNKDKLGEQKMLMLSKFNPSWKEKAKARWESSGTTATRRFAECSLNDQLGSVRGKLTEAIYMGCYKASCEKQNKVEAEAQWELCVLHTGTNHTTLLTAIRNSFLIQRTGERYQEANSTATVRPFTCCSAEQFQWKSMGVSSA